MNIYLREMRANLRSLLLWSAGLVFVIAAGMMKYAAYVTAGESVNALFDGMPLAMQALFGTTQLDLSKASGFYGLLFLYVALMAAIHAAMLGAGILSKEERDKTSEFLYVKPVSRSYIITAKLLAALTNIIVFNLVSFGASLLVFRSVSQGEDLAGFLRTLTVALFLLQVFYLAFGSASAGLAKRPASAARIATGMILGTFLLSVVIDINDKLAPLQYLTPFKYFDAKRLLSPSGQIEPVFVVLSLGLSALFVLAAYLLYRRKDLAI